MSNPYDGGTFFWYWYEWWFPVFFAVVALGIGVVPDRQLEVEGWVWVYKHSFMVQAHTCL
ncbi:MAG: hypothetical protein IIB28_10585 [Chloroflexi bacterium]|nr:hypothetical protein [Chloroflexota bacterium]